MALYPRFLWATLWITMFTSRQKPAPIGLRADARELTSAQACFTPRTTQLPWRAFL
jgi:hypothetical protein